jgi:hypothetical protein
MRYLAIAAAAGAAFGCGRLGFGPVALGDAAAEDAASDAASADAPEPDAPGLPAGLVAWYTLDDTSHADMLGGPTGTCTPPACPTADVGHLGGGLRFDGVDDCVDVADQGQLKPASLTIAVWANQAVNRNISQVSKKFGATGSANSWQLESNALNLVQRSLSFTTYDGNANQFATTAADTIVLSQWQHLAATFDGATKRVYIDGVELADMPYPTTLRYDDNPMKIGCDDNSAGNALFFEGILDDLQLYDRALSAAEIAALAAR